MYAVLIHGFVFSVCVTHFKRKLFILASSVCLCAQTLLSSDKHEPLTT